MLAWKQLFIQRVRNSSLVERQSVDNERASSIPPKFWAPNGAVGEHSILRRSRIVRFGGAYGKANVGISNDKAGE